MKLIGILIDQSCRLSLVNQNRATMKHLWNIFRQNFRQTSGKNPDYPNQDKIDKFYSGPKLNIFKLLPEDPLILILSCLDIKTVGFILPLVSKQVRLIADHDRVWHLLFYNNYHRHPPKKSLISNKLLFKSLLHWHNEGGCLCLENSQGYQVVTGTDPAHSNMCGISLTSKPNLQVSSFTWEFWFRKLQLDSYPVLVLHADLDWSNGYGLYFSGSSLILFINSWTGNSFITATLNSTDWTHVAATFDDSSKQVCIYINGVQAAQAVMNETISYTNVSNLTIGFGTWHSGGVYYQYYLNGYIGEVRMWNYARSANEIKQWKDKYLIDNKKALLLHYKFAPGCKPGSKVIDRSGNGHDGILSNAKTIPHGLNGGGVTSKLLEKVELRPSKYTFHSDFKRLFDEQKGCDVTFVIGEKEIKAHRNILYARSPIFRKLFDSDMTTTVFEVETDYDAFVALLHFMYADCVILDSSYTLISLSILAQVHEQDNLLQLCCENFKPLLSVDNAWHLFEKVWKI